MIRSARRRPPGFLPQARRQYLAGKPFALIGVHLNLEGENAGKVKEVMAKEDLGWRSFVDRGAIASKWKPAGTPTFYVLDVQGVIRCSERLGGNLKRSARSR